MQSIVAGRGWSIRAMLYLLIVASVLPLVALRAYSLYSEYRHDQEQAAQSALSLARVTGDDVEAFLDDTRQMMSRLAARPRIRKMDANDCDSIFSEFRDLYPQFANFSQSNLDGKLICSTNLQPGGLQTVVRDTVWFKRVIKEKKFTVAPPYRGPVTQKVVAVLAHPVFDESGTLVGSIQLPIDLINFRLIAGAMTLPPTTVIAIVDANATIVARSQNAENFVGTSLRDSPIIGLVLALKSGTAQSTSVEKIQRAYGFVQIKGTDWYALAGVESSVLFADAKDAAIRNGLIAAAIVSLVFFLAVYLGKKIVAPIAAMGSVARKIADGAQDLRVPTEGPAEIVEVATQFNAMLDARERSESALAASEQRMNLVLKGANDGWWDWDLAGNRQFHSPRWWEMLGYRPDELPSDARLWRGLLHADDIKRIDHDFAALLAHGPDVYEIEFRLRHKDGRYIPILSRGNILRNAEGRAVRVSGTNADLSERKEAEHRIKSLNQRQELAVQGAGYGIWEFALDSQLFEWDRHMYAIYGFTPEAFDRAAETWAACVHPDDRDRAWQRFSDLRDGLPIEAIEFRIIRAVDSEVRFVEANGFMQRDSEGRAQRLVGMNRDITERKQAESLRAAKEVAEVASRSKSEFLSRMSHELRTPLNSILGFAQLLEHDPVVNSADAVRKKIGHIASAGKHLLQIVNEVLDMSRVEAGALPLSLEPIEVGQLVGDCIALNTPQADSRNIRFEFSAPAKSWIRADRTRLRQVVVNLLSNAIKYNRPAGLIAVGIGGDSGQVSMMIRDTGNGLTPAQIDGLFQPFNRLGAEASGTEGAGIGLVIVKQLVQAMHGTIEVASKPGQGTTFTLGFARAAPGAAESATRAAPRSPIAATDTRFTVLYVEDNPANVELVQETLKLDPRIQLEIATDGESGLVAAGKLKPDLILLDINLPGLDGYEVVKRLRADPQLAGIPCIALSANAMTNDIGRARAAGFTDYITKPFDIDLLLSKLNAFLTRR